MAKVAFTFSVTKKAVKSNSSTTKHKTVNSNTDKEKYTIIAKDLRGVVWITIDGCYKVVVGDNVYDILERNYNCARKKSLYYEDLVENKLVNYIKLSPGNADSVKGYLPFGVGCCVTGMLLRRKRDDRVYFNIKKVFIERNNPDALAAINYYRENLEVINNNRDKSNASIQ